jgi:hypothetical protein
MANREYDFVAELPGDVDQWQVASFKGNLDIMSYRIYVHPAHAPRILTPEGDLKRLELFPLGINGNG